MMNDLMAQKIVLKKKNRMVGKKKVLPYCLLSIIIKGN